MGGKFPEQGPGEGKSKICRKEPIGNVGGKGS
jgi:hypothetical protein